MCDIPDCKRVNYAKIWMDGKVFMRLCAADAYKFCNLVYDFHGAKHVRETIKREMDDSNGKT